MTRTVYVNGRYLPYAQAYVHAEDRGFQFADAIYEVCEVKDGRLVDETRHMQRLARSLGELGMRQPMPPAALSRVMRETIRRNRVSYGLVYLQVSRGARPRDFLFPPPDVAPTVVCLARSVSEARLEAAAAAGIAVKTMPDIRWGRCDIKTVMLLPASLAKEAARAAGAKEAWFFDADDRITEGGSSNAWIVDKEGRLITRQVDNAILRGVTRTTLIDLLRRENIELVERPFTVGEAKAAREAFITSATNTLMPVVRIDDQPIGNGAPGLLTLRLRSEFHSAAETAAD
jgi:D-alanine transaminase